MSEQIAALLEQARLFVLQHAPAELLKEAMPFGILCVLLGVGLSVLGAKLGRFGVTCAFILLGGLVGAYFARIAGFAGSHRGLAAFSTLAAALMVGVIGFHTFRLWVGALTGMVLSAAVLGAFSYQRVLPHVVAFERTGPPITMPAANPGETNEAFGLPTPGEQEAYRSRTFGQWVEEFWAFVAQRDAHVQQNGRVLLLGTMLTGLCLGVVAVRWALILSTAVLGTALVTTGAATLFSHSVPQSVESFQRHPGPFGIAIGAFLVSSLILQTMLTRRTPSGKRERLAKS